MRISDWSSDVCSSDLLLHQPLRKRPLMFKRPSTHYGKSPEPETPYQRAAQVWDDRIGGARVQTKNWRLMAFGSLILSAGFAAALVWQSARGTVVPWVVQVDRLGQAQAVAPAVADYRPTDPQIAFHLRSEEHTSELQSLMRISYA